MKRVLVTGGAGFIGSHVTEELVRNGYHVVVLDDLSGGFVDNIVPGAEFVQGTINDVALVEKLFSENRFEYVYHLAAYAAEGLSHFIKRFNYVNNLVGSVNLINASVNYGVKCFVFTSSIAVYGSCPELPMTEESTAHPEDPYGIAKLAVERELYVSKRMFDLDYVIFRPHNVYGERQNIGDKYRNVVGIFMNQILQGLPMTVFGDGTQTRAFSYISDVAPVIARAPETPAAYNQIFNVGADQPYSVNDLATAVAQAMGAEPHIKYLASREEVAHAFSAHGKLSSIFGDHKACDLQQGLTKMAEWVKQHGARQSTEFGEIEVLKNLPQSWRKAEKPALVG
ncbi:MAG: NAD-dependent epimerase/dehydratase family protein [Acidobacteriota bacterium]